MHNRIKLQRFIKSNLQYIWSLIPLEKSGNERLKNIMFLGATAIPTLCSKSISKEGSWVFEAYLALVVAIIFWELCMYLFSFNKIPVSNVKDWSTELTFVQKDIISSDFEEWSYQDWKEKMDDIVYRIQTYLEGIYEDSDVKIRISLMVSVRDKNEIKKMEEVCDFNYSNIYAADMNDGIRSKEEVASYLPIIYKSPGQHSYGDRYLRVHRTRKHAQIGAPLVLHKLKEKSNNVDREGFNPNFASTYYPDTSDLDSDFHEGLSEDTQQSVKEYFQDQEDLKSFASFAFTDPQSEWTTVLNINGSVPYFLGNHVTEHLAMSVIQSYSSIVGKLVNIFMSERERWLEEGGHDE